MTNPASVPMGVKTDLTTAVFRISSLGILSSFGIRHAPLSVGTGLPSNTSCLRDDAARSLATVPDHIPLAGGQVLLLGNPRPAYCRHGV